MNMIAPIHTADTASVPPPARSRWRRAGWIAVPVVALGAAWGVLHQDSSAVAAMPAPT